MPAPLLSLSPSTVNVPPPVVTSALAPESVTFAVAASVTSPPPDVMASSTVIALAAAISIAAFVAATPTSARSPVLNTRTPPVPPSASKSETAMFSGDVVPTPCAASMASSTSVKTVAEPPSFTVPPVMISKVSQLAREMGALKITLPTPAPPNTTSPAVIVSSSASESSYLSAEVAAVLPRSGKRPA